MKFNAKISIDETKLDQISKGENPKNIIIKEFARLQDGGIKLTELSPSIEKNDKYKLRVVMESLVTEQITDTKIIDIELSDKQLKQINENEDYYIKDVFFSKTNLI